MRTCAQYIAAAKRAAGDALMSDEQLGEALRRFNKGDAYSQSLVSRGKSRHMSDHLALAIGKLLAEAGVIEHAGEVVMAARVEREKNVDVSAALKAYAGKITALAASAAARASQSARSALVAEREDSANWRKR